MSLYDVLSEFMYQPEDMITSDAIVRKLQAEMPGNYTPIVRFIDYGISVEFVFDDKIEETVFKLKYQLT